MNGQESAEKYKAGQKQVHVLTFLISLEDRKAERKRLTDT